MEDDNMKNKRNFIFILILLLVIGFATATTTLVINSTTNIGNKTGDFKVYFKEAILDNVDVSTTAISDDKKTITFSTKKLSMIGDTSILNYQVYNDSTQYDAKVKITCTIPSSEYVDIESEFNGNETPTTEIIEAQGTLRGSIIARLKKGNVTETQESVSVNCELEVNAEDKEEIIEKKNFVKVNINGIEEEYSTNTGTITLNNISFNENEYVIGCNNGIGVDYTDTTLTLTNINEDSKCRTYASLKESSTAIDNTENTLVLLKDEHYLNEQINFIDKNINLNFNGYYIYADNTNNSSSSSIYTIKAKGTTIAKLYANNNGGIIATSSGGGSYTCFLVSDNARVDVISGYYYSDSVSYHLPTMTLCSSQSNAELNILGEPADNCTDNKDDYHSGLCLYSENASALKHCASGTGNLNIYDGTFVSKNFYSYFTDNRDGGITNIYGGQYKDSLGSIRSTGSNTTINVCGGNFTNPIDIFLENDGTLVKYKPSSNIIWYNNASTPNIQGDYASNVSVDDSLTCSIN